ncbi:MAG: prepilin-type N-terminal cleavage/methylation domain-containing protein [Candidatus Omnitrophota bacterium]
MMRRAFTLFEVLVAAVIFSFIIAGIYAVMNAGRAMYDADMGRLDLQASARRAIDIVTTELRQTSLSNITISDDDTSIEFEIPVNITSAVAEYSGPIAYYKNDANQLVREYPSGTDNIIAQYVSDVEFCCWNGISCVANCGQADSVIVRFSFSTTVNQRVVQLNVTEKVAVRNVF